MKRIVVFILIVFALIAFASCNQKTDSTDADAQLQTQETATQKPAEEPQDTEAPEQLSLTLDELKEYNGKDGMPAYVAYDGVIYDVSDVPQWATGIHGGNMAGTDITEKLKTVSHGTTKLEGLAVVGKVVE